MSPSLLARLRADYFAAQRLVARTRRVHPDLALYPRDYWRPYEVIWVMANFRKRKGR
jgi:hypothetical protein